MSSPNLRPARTQETRETQSRSYDYQPPSTLPDVLESPDWVYRWISTSVVGKPDDQNVARRLDDEWEFVPYDEREKVLKNPKAFRSINSSNKTGMITIGALSLGRMARERAEGRAAYYRDLTRQQVTGVREQNSARFESDTKLDQEIKSASGRRPVQFG